MVKHGFSDESVPEDYWGYSAPVGGAVGRTPADGGAYWSTPTRGQDVPEWEPEPAGDDDYYYEGDEGAAEDVAADVPPPRKKRRAGDIVLLVLALMLMTGGAIVGAVTLWKSSHEVTFPDLNNRRVIPDDTSIADPGYIEQADAKDDMGLRFKIASVNLDVPLGEVNAVNNVINPPGFTSAYVVRNLGVSMDKASTGTLYVVTHSVRPPGMAPGNFVINIAAGSIIVANGSIINVGDLKYSVTSSFVINKADLDTRPDLWAGTPGLLVFITCLQYPNAADYNGVGHSHDNAVILAKLAQ